MRTLSLVVIVLLALGLPAAASQQLNIPPSVALRMTQTNLYRLSAFTPRHRLAVVANTCFSSPARADDVVRVVYEGKSTGSSGTVIAIDIRPNRIGTCTVTFNNDLETGVTTITVSQ